MIHKQIFRHTAGRIKGLETSIRHLKQKDPIGTIFQIHGYNTSKEGLKINRVLKFCESSNVDHISFDLLGK